MAQSSGSPATARSAWLAERTRATITSVDVFVLLRLVGTLATILIGFALLKRREQIVDSSWPWRWLIGLDERLRRPLEVLYVLTGMVLIVLGAGGLYVLARQAP